jgi:cyclophilin family peptidyl-prolyl cis-trans isomerase
MLSVCAWCGLLAARAQVSTNPNNTIVRFDITTEGTNFGSLDVELFDADKPETVKNFLLYVYSGGFSNLLVQRVETNFVLQAGSRRVEKPGTTNEFNSYLPGKNFGQITNEYSVGPELSNLFGTIAMARQSGQTNSASSDFFFNLNDNTSLDTVDGGFTVFGRVINTTGPNTGTNLLNTFRSFPNITYVCFSSFFGFCFDGVDQLPVATLRYSYSTNFTTNDVSGEVTETITTNTAPVQVRDVFTMNPSIIQGAPRETVRPKLAVREPTPKLRVVTNAPLSFHGTASDNAEVARVLYSVGGGSETVASGTTNWSQDFTLSPGTNIIRFKTIDRFGNESKPVTRRIFYKVSVPIVLSNTPGGVIIGATNGQLLDIGRNYTIQARPSPGNFFVGWRGSSFTPVPVLTFNMQQGYFFTALFATNPFPRLGGTYFGIMTPVNTNSGARVAGTITLSLGPKGIYSGRLQPLTGSYPIRGIFNVGNTSTIGGLRNGTPLALVLGIATNGVPQIVGSYSDGDMVASVQMYRLERFIDSNAPQAGHFTFALAPQTNSAIGEGFGVGTADVSEDGRVFFDGLLQNGTGLSGSNSIYSGAHFPIVNTWNKDSAVLGWMAFNTNSDGFTGDVRYISPSLPTPNGEFAQATGSRYVAPISGAAPLNWTNGTLVLSGDDLEGEIEVPVSFNGTDFVPAANSVNLQISTSAADGTLTGSFTHPGTSAATELRAVFLQNSNMAAGFFPGPARSGAVRLRSAE